MVFCMNPIQRAIIICALGYFIDVFDIQLFAVLRVPSLRALGLSADQMATVGGHILNMQMLGMILGGFVWGWLGDRFGRVRALYGSILIYSLGTFACSFIRDATAYGLLRFVTGFGLAGEVGAAVVLIAELMPQEERGWGITLIGAIGFLGPVFAVLTSFVLDWRQTYIAAGIFGLLILVLRVRLIEPQLFKKIERHQSLKDFYKLVLRPSCLKRMLACLLMASPLVYGWSLLNFFSIELGHAVLGPGVLFNQKICLLLFFAGTSCGDVLSGVATQIWRSRRKAMSAVLGVGAVVVLVYLAACPLIKIPANILYAIYFVLGLTTGCWALAVLITSEHFGTDMRATSSLVMLNLLRGLTIPIVFAFQWLREAMAITNAALVIGFVLYALAFLALRTLRETHGASLDYIEAARRG